VIQPLDDRVLVRPEPTEERTTGGIILPDAAQEKPQQGTVVAVGTDEDLRAVLAAGDRVLYAKYGGNEIKLKGVTHDILQRADILGKFQD